MLAESFEGAFCAVSLVCGNFPEHFEREVQAVIGSVLAQNPVFWQYAPEKILRLSVYDVLFNHLFAMSNHLLLSQNVGWSSDFDVDTIVSIP